MAKLKFGEVAEFDGCDRLTKDIEGREIVVFEVCGEYHAILNYCVHQGGPLGEGKLTTRPDLSDDRWMWEDPADCATGVMCPWHGWTFDVRTGDNVDDDDYAVPTYDVSVEGDAIFIEL